METAEFWVLSEAEESLVDRLSLGIGRRPARVLAYLISRTTSIDVAEPWATQLQIRIGTGYGRQATIDALSTLEGAGFIEATTLDRGSGRPPKAWRVKDDCARTVERVYRHHATELLSRAAAEIDETSDTEDTAIEHDSLEFGLNWLPNGLHVPFYAASLSDAYANRDVGVTFTHYRGSRQVLSAILDQTADVGIVGAATLVKARTEGASVVPIAVPYQRAMAVLYTTRSAFGEPFESVEQLCGQRVGMSSGTETGLLGRLFLAHADLEDITIVETVGEEAEALHSGEADVVAGSFSDPDKLRGEDTVDVFRIAEQFPIYGSALVVRPKTLRYHRGTLESFLAGTMSGWTTAREEPESAIDYVATLGDDDKGKVGETSRRALAEFADSKSSREHGWGYHEPTGWERIRTALSQAMMVGTE